MRRSASSRTPSSCRWAVHLFISFQHLFISFPHIFTRRWGEYSFEKAKEPYVVMELIESNAKLLGSAIEGTPPLTIAEQRLIVRPRRLKVNDFQ